MCLSAQLPARLFVCLSVLRSLALSLWTHGSVLDDPIMSILGGHNLPRDLLCLVAESSKCFWQTTERSRESWGLHPSVLQSVHLSAPYPPIPPPYPTLGQGKALCQVNFRDLGEGAEGTIRGVSWEGCQGLGGSEPLLYLLRSPRQEDCKFKAAVG